MGDHTVVIEGVAFADTTIAEDLEAFLEDREDIWDTTVSDTHGQLDAFVDERLRGRH